MIYEAIERLIDYAVKRNIITLPDAVFVRNRLLDLLGLTSYESCQADSGDMEIDEILSPLIDYAVEKGIIADTGASRDLFDTRVMGLYRGYLRIRARHFHRGRVYRVEK